MTSHKEGGGVRLKCVTEGGGIVNTTVKIPLPVSQILETGIKPVMFNLRPQLSKYHDLTKIVSILF